MPRRAQPHLRLLPQPSPDLGRRLLVVVEPHRPLESLWALARANDIARSRRVELDVLAVLPLHLAARKATRIDRLLERSIARRLFVRTGHVTTRTAEVAKQLGVDLIVVGAKRKTGGNWVRLARRLDIPLIVARPRLRRCSIVAATDFTDERFPVLSSAQTVVTREASGVVLLHNVDPAGRSFNRHFGFVLGERGLRQLRDMRAEKLHALAATSGPNVLAILSGNVDPVSAVGEHASRSAADLVVIGAHRPLPKRRSPRTRTAERIVERVPSSTLVIPLPPHELVA